MLLPGNATIETVGLGNLHWHNVERERFFACRWHWFVHTDRLTTLWCYGAYLEEANDEICG